MQINFRKKAQPKQKVPQNETVPVREPLRLDAEFYREHYLRGLKYILILCVANALMVIYAWSLLRHHYLADVYAATIEGKLFPLNEVQAPLAKLKSAPATQTQVPEPQTNHETPVPNTAPAPTTAATQTTPASTTSISPTPTTTTPTSP